MFLFDWFYGVLASLGLWQKEAKILLLGTEVEGRARLRHMLNDERELSSGRIKFKAFDLGDLQNALRVLRVYHAKFDAVVYVVEAHDDLIIGGLLDLSFYQLWFALSKEELHALLSDESLANVPFLILLNSINMPCTNSEWVLHRLLGLSNLTTGKGNVNLANSNVRPLEVFMCSLVRKMGYDDGFKWLSQYIT